MIRNAASKALKQMLQEMCNARNAKLFVPAFEYCVDNAAMIAWLGLLMQKAGIKQKIAETKINQDFRTDQQKVCWT